MDWGLHALGKPEKLLLMVAFLCFALNHPSLHAQEFCGNGIAVLTSVQGQVDLRSGTDSAWHPAELNAPLCAGNEVRTGALSRAQVRLTQTALDGRSGGTLMQLNERSSLVLPKVGQSGWVDLIRGAIHILTRTPRDLTIKTAFCNAKVDGTEFLVQTESARSEVAVYEGQVLVSNALGSAQLSNGEHAVSESNKAPRREILIKPRDAVQWALYYPPVIDPRLPPPGPNQSLYRPVLEQYRQGRIAEAIASLDTLGEARRDAYYYGLRAALYLSAGQVQYARKALSSATALQANDATVYALESVIALAQNEKDKALDFAKRAFAADRESPTGWVADSYAQQANFKLDAALESARRAVALGADNALAWSRVAELELSLGNRREAEQAADRARGLDPTLARSLTIAGYAALMRIDVPKAKADFSTAIARDSTDPLPRLGLGLAKIRAGQLAEGRKDLEDAANIDPDNAVVRSYLGKAYFEEKRNDLAAKELENAKLLDPKDPTPWFYDAVRKQSENRPIEAVEDLQKSIELNDNRAIYRSALSLDKDYAARGAAVGRIYNTLGFRSRGLVEGWRAVSQDPTDHTAHRLLSDTYSVLPRHEIARVSELLQSQLLQTLNVSPVQPQLAESSLIPLGGLGPADASLNEFNPLFHRSRLTLLASGIAGSQNTFGDELVQSGIGERLSYSLGQYHYQSDGFRRNNDLRQDLYNAFFQYALSDTLNVQLEYRRRERDQGYLQQNFDPTKFSDSFREQITQDTVRIGAHYAPWTHNDFLVSALYTHRTETQPPGATRFAENGYQLEAQHLYHRGPLATVIGGGIYRVEGQQTQDFGPEGGIVPSFLALKHDNAYVYMNYSPKQAVTLTTGLAFDTLTLFETDAQYLSPKLGLQVGLTDWIRLRFAYFRSVKRRVLVDATIEPTQVAGFNQFFDDPNGTYAERYGAGLDFLSGKFYWGIEHTWRNLAVPSAVFRGSPPEPASETVKRGEDLSRAYWYWTPHPQWAVRVEAQREFYGNVKDELPVLFGGLAITTQNLIFPFSLLHFNPNGFFAGLTGTLVNQDVGFPASQGTSNSRFFVLDANLGYRFAKRRGLISLQAKNLLGEDFVFQDLTPFQVSRELDYARFIPEPTVFVRGTIQFD